MNTLTGKIGIIYPTQTIAAKNGGNPIVKREFVIRALRFNPDDGTPELNERSTPILEIQGQDRVGVLDNFKVGDIVKVGIVVEGRGVKNQDGTYKFFNSVRVTRVEKLNITLDDAPQKQAKQQAQQQAQAQGGTQAQAPSADDEPDPAGPNALPF